MSLTHNDWVVHRWTCSYIDGLARQKGRDAREKGKLSHYDKSKSW